MPAPRGIVCHICGGKYFKRSFPIHLKQCEKKWKLTHSECTNCGQMVHKCDWSDHIRHCKKKLSKKERDFVSKGPPKCMTALCDSRTGNLSKEDAAELIELGTLDELFPAGDPRIPCKVCGRKFNPDRIDKHTRICFERKQNKRKRKKWDAEKKRLENTDFEQYAGKNRPPTPPEIADWKKNGRRWREESANFQKIVHADDPDYIPDVLLKKSSINFPTKEEKIASRTSKILSSRREAKNLSSRREANLLKNQKLSARREKKNNKLSARDKKEKPKLVSKNLSSRGERRSSARKFSARKQNFHGKKLSKEKTFEASISDENVLFVTENEKKEDIITKDDFLLKSQEQEFSAEAFISKTKSSANDVVMKNNYHHSPNLIVGKNTFQTMEGEPKIRLKSSSFKEEKVSSPEVSSLKQNKNPPRTPESCDKKVEEEEILSNIKIIPKNEKTTNYKRRQMEKSKQENKAKRKNTPVSRQRQRLATNKSTRVRNQRKSQNEPTQKTEKKISAITRKRIAQRQAKAEATSGANQNKNRTKPSIREKNRASAKDHQRKSMRSSRRNKKPAIPKLSARSNKAKDKNSPSVPKILKEDVKNAKSEEEKRRRLDELLSKRNVVQPAEVETKSSKPPSRSRRTPLGRKSNINSNVGKSIVSSEHPTTTTTSSSSVSYQHKVYKNSGRLGQRGGNLGNPDYKAPKHKLTMEEYRVREKRRRKEAKNSNRGHRAPLRTENSNVMKSNVNQNSSPNHHQAPPPTNFTSNNNENRRLSRKYFGEPQSVGGKAKPNSQEEMRRKRAAYYDRLLNSA